MNYFDTLFAKKLAGGGSSPNLEEVTKSYTANGDDVILPGEGYDGLSKVDVSVNVPSGLPEAPEDALLFWSLHPFTLATYNNAKNWDGTLYYSTDYSTWNEWDGVSVLDSSNNPNLCSLYIRGASNTYLTGANNFNDLTKRWVISGVVNCVGDIKNLLDYTSPSPTMGDGAFAGLFAYSEAVDFGKLNLSFDVVAKKAYSCMFTYCKGMLTPPALPATTLGASACYQMYKYCSSITSAPDLVAANASNGCYQEMFANCTSLKKAPKIYATTTEQYTFYIMFGGCTSLEEIPVLLSTTIATAAYQNMFSGCSKIKLSTTQEGDYQNEYRIPASGTGSAPSNALSGMFSTTGGTFTGTPTINTTYYTSNTVVSPT